MGFSQALSGVNAAAKQLDVTGNNIANSQTTGFKSSSVQFADVFAAQSGLGTRVAGKLQDFSSGALEATGRNLDLAIAGTGFYRFEQEGQVGYSRNGQLTMTANGDLVNAQGAKLMGFGLANKNDAFSRVVPGGQPVALNVPANDMPAQATGKGNGEKTGVQAVYNLDANIDASRAELKNTVELHSGLPKTADNKTEAVNYHYSNSFTVYDSLGKAQNVSAYFEKSADALNTWNVELAINDVLVDNRFQLEFNADGTLKKNAGNDIIGVDGGAKKAVVFGSESFNPDADALEFDFHLAGSTQFANDSTAIALTQDGYTSGSLVGITIESDGTVMRNFSNEKSVPAGQIALANFRNPEGLRPMGDNLWSATGESGNEVVGVAGVGMLGSIESGTLEASNVDLSKELVDLIIAQRSYQANTNSLRTQSEVMEAIAQLR